MVLILTVEQERAIIDLFQQRQWKYVKAGMRLFPLYMHRSCKTTLPCHYHVVLILTVEQERAIIDLFKQRQWKYVKACKRLFPL